MQVRRTAGTVLVHLYPNSSHHGGWPACPTKIGYFPILIFLRSWKLASSQIIDRSSGTSFKNKVKVVRDVDFRGRLARGFFNLAIFVFVKMQLVLKGRVYLWSFDVCKAISKVVFIYRST